MFRVITILLMLGASQIGLAQEQCSELEAREAQCLGDLSDARSSNSTKRAQYQDLMDSLNNPEQHLRDLRQCRRDISDLEYDLDQLKDDERDIEQKLGRVSQRNRQLNREYEQLERRLFVEVECMVSDRRFANTGVGQGRNEREATMAAKSDILRDEIEDVRRKLKKPNLKPERKAQLERKEAELVRARRSALKKGVHAFCYKKYRGQS